MLTEHEKLDLTIEGLKQVALNNTNLPENPDCARSWLKMIGIEQIAVKGGTCGLVDEHCRADENDDCWHCVDWS